jgi:Peptidase family M41/ATPase family associated with various cellular activities (AAA)
MAPAPDEAGRMVSRFVSPGTGGMVNELLIQMQSFDQPRWSQRVKERLIEWLNGYLADGRRLKAGKPRYHNILLIAATNRGESLDGALLRPGRFDRRLYFDLPTKQARRELLDYFLPRKSHAPELDEEDVRDRLAQDTFGYTPVMIEHLFDEALLVALRRGRDAMTLSDVYEAKLTEEIGLKQGVSYTEAERAAVATHEAGHAVVAHVLGTARRLEVLSIIKRRSSLGLLAHTDLEERFTQSRTEMQAMIAIALGGLTAEEIFLGESGTGPGADLAKATEVAALMVGALGMGSSLISYEAVAEASSPERTSSARSSPTATRKNRSRTCWRRRRRASARSSTRTGTWSKRSGTRCWTGTSWSERRSLRSSARPSIAGRRVRSIPSRSSTSSRRAANRLLPDQLHGRLGGRIARARPSGGTSSASDTCWS